MRKFLLLLFFFGLGALPAFAGLEQISEEEFRALAAELAPKVNLFQAGWEKDSQAEFYGGTTRDYLYWLKGQFVNAHNPAQAEAVVKKLKQVPAIDVRDFIIGDSDVDIISKQLGGLRAEDFGVRKIDAQSPDILNPATELGKNEMLQGYIPAEKIRLAQDGFHPSTLGNGIKEIYQGKLSVHFASAEDFAESKYAREGVNHPILLSLRYLRLQAINYYRTHGKGFPDPTKLHSGMDEASAKAVKAVIDSAMQTGELRSYLARPKFKSWINGAIQKAFRSYTNPTAALQLMKEFGVDKLPERYPHEIETLNQYVFTKFHDPATVRATLEKYGIDPEKLYTPTENFFPDGRIYHGTKTEAAFRGIIFQGVMPSEHGSASGGLYGVAVGNKEFSEKWAGDKNRLLSFAVDPNAKIVDLTTGEGARAWGVRNNFPGDKYDDFAEMFGADVLKYPYGGTEAFVVKNGGVLSDGQGVYRTIMGFGALVEKAKTLPIEQIVELLSVNSLSTAERALVWDAADLKLDKVLEFAKSQQDFLGYKIPRQAVMELLGRPKWVGGKDVGELLKSWTLSNDAQPIATAAELFFEVPHPDATRLALLDQLSQEPKVVHEFKSQAKLFDYMRTNAEPQPLSIEAGIKAYEEFAKNLEAGAKANDPLSYATYIADAKLSPDQLGRLDAVIKKLPEIYNHKHHFFPALLRKGYQRDEIKAEVLGAIKSLNNINTGAALDILLEAVIPFFKDDPKMQEAIYNFFTIRIPQIRDDDMGRILIISRVIKDNQKARDHLFQMATGPYHQWAQRSLAYLDLNDHELARFLDSFEYDSRSTSSLVYYLNSHKNLKPGPESAKAMMRAYIRVRGEGSFGHLLQLKFLLNSYSDPKLLQDYMEEILSNPERIALVSRTYDLPKREEVERAFTMFEPGVIPSSPKLDEKILAYTESHAALPLNRAVYEVANRQDLSDPAIAHRVMKLVNDNKISFPVPADMIALLRRMPKGCPASFGMFLRD